MPAKSYLRKTLPARHPLRRDPSVVYGEPPLSFGTVKNDGVKRPFSGIHKPKPWCCGLGMAVQSGIPADSNSRPTVFNGSKRQPPTCMHESPLTIAVHIPILSLTFDMWRGRSSRQSNLS